MRKKFANLTINLNIMCLKRWYNSRIRAKKVRVPCREVRRLEGGVHVPGREVRGLAAHNQCRRVSEDREKPEWSLRTGSRETRKGWRRDLSHAVGGGWVAHPFISSTWRRAWRLVPEDFRLGQFDVPGACFGGVGSPGCLLKQGCHTSAWDSALV